MVKSSAVGMCQSITKMHGCNNIKSTFIHMELHKHAHKTNRGQLQKYYCPRRNL
jgi:hypothetical protein